MQLAYAVATSRYLYGTDSGLSFQAFLEVTYQTTWNVDVYDARAAVAGMPAYSPESFDPKLGYDPDLGGDLPYPLLEDNDPRRQYFAFADWVHPDSASTTTAMSTGLKTRSGAIAWQTTGATTGAIETSPEVLRRLYGMSLGYVTTIPFSHARTAGFFAHNPDRGNRQDIANEILMSVRPDVVVGGGWNNFDYYRDADLQAALASDDWVFERLISGGDHDSAILAASARAIGGGKRLLGLYGGGIAEDFIAPVALHDPGNPSVDHSMLDRPLLTHSSLAALELLARDGDGFFLLVEQGQIDWTSLSSDFGTMIGCVWELDQTVRTIVDFVEREGDDIDWSNTTLLVTAGHANGYLRFGRSLRQGELPAVVVDPSNPQNVTYPNGEISYGCPGVDTSELTPVYARGMAAAKIHDYEDVYPGRRIVDNTSLYHLTLDAARR